MFNRLWFAFLLFLPVFSTATAAESFVAGKDYVILKTTPLDEPDSQVVNVTEFFSYGCPWCYRIDTQLNHWAHEKGKGIFYSKVPVIFNQDWEYYARAYYTAEALSLEKTLTPELFKAILKDKKALNSNHAMIDYFKSHGVQETIAQSAFQHAQSIDIEIDNSKRKMAQYQINAIPALIVNSRYKTDLQMAKNQTRLLEILDFLVEKAHHDKHHRL